MLFFRIKKVEWQEQTDIPRQVYDVRPLFERIDTNLIEQEYNHLMDCSPNYSS